MQKVIDNQAKRKELDEMKAKLASKDSGDAN
jgi:hypothetical protein